MNLFPPLNFSYHGPNIVRGAFPTKENANFLVSLGVRKFVPLGNLPGPDEREMGRKNKLEFRHFPLPFEPESVEFEEQLPHIMKFITSQHPESRLYLYDDSGNSQVGIVCALLRKIEGWNFINAAEEHVRFGGTLRHGILEIIRDYDVSYWQS